MKVIYHQRVTVIPWPFVFVCLSWANDAISIPRISREHPPGAAFGGIWLQVAMISDQAKRPGQRVDDLVWRARPAGFEPATVGLEVKYASTENHAVHLRKLFVVPSVNPDLGTYLA
ncbi:hypothetical protein [Sphaerisporangium fuscum]|uniref:hypothetical protein n=1 Tax=Sphaerisporangium fuscum TaxID=2835868 RepID=UPI001BDD6ECE|nr:hypothetical protein [Sphaerisporangium fuscum]